MPEKFPLLQLSILAAFWFCSPVSSQIRGRPISALAKTNATAASLVASANSVFNAPKTTKSGDYLGDKMDELKN